LFRQRNLLKKPSKLTIAISAAGVGVAAAASAVAVTLPGGATAGAATIAVSLSGASVTSLNGASVTQAAASAPLADAMPRWAEQLQANKLEKVQRAHLLAAAKARKAVARRAARRTVHRAAALAAQHQARQAHGTPSTSSAPAQPSGAAPSGVWACIAQHESGGNPAANTGNGFYGAFQFTLASWQAAGGPPGLPSNYPLSVQVHYAEVLQARSGWGNWPVTSQMCGA
jgi:Transglycosylase-like domain